MRRLAGAVLGLRGALGGMNYEVFDVTPISRAQKQMFLDLKELSCEGAYFAWQPSAGSGRRVSWSGSNHRANQQVCH